MERGSIVRATRGRDADGIFAVLSEEDGFLLLADGRTRKLAHPKKKSRRHIEPTGFQLQAADLSTDRALRRALNSCRVPTEKTNRNRKG